MSGDVDALGLVASAALVAVAVVLSLQGRLGLERRIVGASLRAAAQLLLVGSVLALIIRPGASLVWSWLWVAGMVVLAGVIVRRRAGIPGLVGLGTIAFAAAVTITLALLFALGTFPMEPRTVVPLAGMVIGNSMNASVLAARRVVEEFADKRAEVEVRLALGHPSHVAARPYLAAALRTALIPQIETTRTVGVIFLPGAMTGLILAGVDPLDAVLVQAAIMYMVLGAVATTATVVATGLVRRLFTRDHRLRPLPRPVS